MATGRPTLYRPEFCDTARAVLAEGHSVAGLAGKIGVATSTVKLWVQEHPAFSAAVKEGQAMAAAWWEARLLAMANDKDAGHATAIIFGLKNRAREEWRDVTTSEISGPEGGPIQTEEVGAKDRLAAFLRDRSTKPE